MIMDRKTFIKTCGAGCLAALGLPAMLSSCAGNKYIVVEGKEKLTVPKKEFQKEGSSKFNTHLVVKSGLAYPIALYRFSANDYSALLMQCSHQQMELNMNGHLLTCPAHGSEFGTRGEVVQGPAELALHSYRVSTDEENIYIHIL